MVHLELHTGDLGGARGLYSTLCGWRPEEIDTPSGSYLGAGARQRGRRRDSRVSNAPSDVGAVRGGRPTCSADGSGPSARSLGVAGATGGPGRLAQRDRDPRRGRDRVLAVEASVGARGGGIVSARRPGRCGPRRATRTAFARLVEQQPSRPAGPLLPDARLSAGRRGCPPGGHVRAWRALSGSRGEARFAPGSTRSRPTLPEGDRAAACAGAAGRLRPGRGSHEGPAEPLVESVRVEPYPDDVLGLEDVFASPDARYRAARGGRAGLHRVASAPARPPARRADPARRPRLLGGRGRGHARHQVRRPSTAPFNARTGRSTSGFPTGASRRLCAPRG